MKRDGGKRRERKRLARKALLAARCQTCGVPPGLIEAMAGDKFDVIQRGPDWFEFVAKDAGEVVRPAA